MKNKMEKQLSMVTIPLSEYDELRKFTSAQIPKAYIAGYKSKDVGDGGEYYYRDENEMFDMLVERLMYQYGARVQDVERSKRNFLILKNFSIWEFLKWKNNKIPPFHVEGY
jgi:hypothetical protein